MIKVVLFDVDGTLVTLGDTLNAEAWAYGFEALGFADASPSMVPHAGFTDLQTAEVVLRHCGVDEASAEAIARQVLEQKDKRLTELVHERIELDGHDAARLSALPGAQDLVARLQRDEVLVGLITGNSEYSAKIKLIRAGFALVWFKIGGYGDQVRERSAAVAAAINQAQCQMRGLRRDEIAVIGDTELDIQAGRANGVRTVAVASGRHPRARLEQVSPDLLVDSLSDAQVIPFLRGSLADLCAGQAA